MRFQRSLRKWARRAWRASITLVVLLAMLIVAATVARDAAARARANALLAKLPAGMPSSMSGMNMAGMGSAGSDTNMAGMGSSGSAMNMAGMGSTTMGMDMDTSDPHMTMTPLTGTPTAADIANAKAILAAARETAAKYGDISVATAAGYKRATPFIDGMAHYTNYLYAILAGIQMFDPSRPTSLLFTRSLTGYHLVGEMLTAPESDTVADLNALVPTSIARWHFHHDLCISGVLAGKAPNAASCVAGGGVWWAKTGWMLHIWTDQPDLAHAFAPDHPAT